MPIQVMVVEDEWYWASAVARHIEEAEGMSLAGIATTADDAIALAVEKQPDVALIDLLLGEDSGIRVARVLSNRATKTRVVIFTTEPTPWALQQATSAGVASFVAKDDLVSHADLLDVIRSAATSPPQSPTSALPPRASPGGNELPYGLLDHEREFIRCLAAGWGTPQLTAHFCVTGQTVRNRTTAIGKKMGVSGRLEIVAKALGEGIIPAPHSGV